MEFKFERTRIDKMPRDLIIKELRRVAKLFDYTVFVWREFDKVSKLCESNTVKKNFNGSWSRALNTIGVTLMKRSRKKFSNEDLFVERIWKLLGHRPSRIEWETSQPKIGLQYIQNSFWWMDIRLSKIC